MGKGACYGYGAPPGAMLQTSASTHVEVSSTNRAKIAMHCTKFEVRPNPEQCRLESGRSGAKVDELRSKSAQIWAYAAQIRSTMAQILQTSTQIPSTTNNIDLDESAPDLVGLVSNSPDVLA